MLTKTQRHVLQRMADGWRLIERPYEYCCLFPPGMGQPETVRYPTLRALGAAGLITEEEGDRGWHRTYVLTEQGRGRLDADL